MKVKFIVVISVLMCSAFSMQAQSKIGYINSLELLSFMPEIKKADSVLKKLADDMQVQYETYVKEYQTKLTDYDANAGSWSEVKRSDVETDLVNLQARISEYQQLSQERIQKRKQELYDPLVSKANDAIQAVGKEQNFTCIIDASTGALIYAGEDMINILTMVKTKLNIN
ncbi:MAG: OmpH family outer membrane protein [Chitinophagales bacterium]